MQTFLVTVYKHNIQTWPHIAGKGAR